MSHGKAVPIRQRIEAKAHDAWCLDIQCITECRQGIAHENAVGAHIIPEAPGVGRAPRTVGLLL